MSDGKTIAVVGATGAQGGGLAQAILADPGSGFTVRALTRKPDGDAARALAAQGAEVVQADLDDPASVERAFAGCHGAFCVTNFWESFDPAKEKAQAKTMAEAARKTGLAHVIWSTLDDTREHIPLSDDRMPTLMGEYKVAHFDAKGEADRYFRSAGVPTTFLRTVFYWENFIHFGQGPQRGEDGALQLVLPLGQAGMPGIAVADIGKAALAIFKRGSEMVGQTVGIAGGHPTGQEMADAFSRALGEEVRYVDIDPSVYRTFDYPGAEDMGNMYQFKRDFEDEYRASRPVEATRELVPDVQDFEGWVRANKDGIPVPPRPAAPPA